MNTPSLRTHRVLLACTSLTSIVSLTLLFGWGPLTPPAGVVSGTAKPLSEVEPRTAISAANTPGDADSLFKITQPGSYYLTGNVTGVAGRHGVEIAASGVTLDLNGFDLAGVSGMGAFDGVNVTASSLTGIAVVNGSVRNWGDEGVDLGTATAGRVEGVRANGNTGDGIHVGAGSVIAGCAADGNGQDGMSAPNGATITGCSAQNNVSDGISVGFVCTIAGCTAQVNGANGIVATNGCTIADCTAGSNTGQGIRVGFAASIHGCAVRGNGTDGIFINEQCHVWGNACAINGLGGTGAGINALGGHNRIEDNNCTGADIGLLVAGSGNVIVRNTCSSNTTNNWSIVANNVCGPILNRLAPASAAVSGDSASSSLGSTDANANYTY